MRFSNVDIDRISGEIHLPLNMGIHNQCAIKQSGSTPGLYLIIACYLISLRLPSIPVMGDLQYLCL